MPRFLWTQKQDVGPAPRIGHAMTFDAAKNKVLLFGGDSMRNRSFNDTWSWDGENWTQVADTGPSPRSKHAMVYDGTQVVLFGGVGADGNHNDTWSWDGEEWTEVADTGPSERLGHAMAFDGARGQVVLFGGRSAAGLQQDTWVWDGTDWTKVEDTGPSPRQSFGMCFDVGRGRIVLFGGDAGAATVGDTWEWDGNLWTQVADMGPDACASPAMAFMSNRTALYGGVTSTDPNVNARVIGNTWEWYGKHWTQRQDIGPGPRWNHAMTFDGTRGRLVLFGGLPVAPNDATVPDKLLGDTWEHTDQPAAAPSGPPAPPGPPGPGLDVPPPTIVSMQAVPATISASEPNPVIVTVTISGAQGDSAVLIGYSPNVLEVFGGPELQPVSGPGLPPDTVAILVFNSGTTQLIFQAALGQGLGAPGLEVQIEGTPISASGTPGQPTSTQVTIAQ